MIQERQSKIKSLFLKKSLAYNRVFDKENQFTKDVLFDLAKFCRAHDTCFHKDPRMSDILEGRREVWLRIQQYLNLDIDEIYKLHNVKGE